MAIIDRIKYDGPEDGSQWLIYKCPSEEFVLGSQLVVNQGQEALFFKGGEALDLFGPGTHTLSTGNLPILNKLVKLPFGGKTPFSAEVYYINKTVNMDMNWGTSNPIPIEDPKYGLILNVGARGQYGISIVDSRVFVVKMIGAMPGGTMVNHLFAMRYFNGIVNSQIKTVAAELMIKEKISFLEISQYLSELSEDFKEKLDSEFERFGMELTNFTCITIAPKQDEYKKLQEYKEELALGVEFYKTRRSFEIMEKLAENQSAGGVANTGIGLGIGLGVTGQVGNIFSGLSENCNPNFQTTRSSALNESVLVCPKCGASNSSKMKFCGECGMEFTTTTICPHCGAQIPAGMKFCGECGNKLTSGKCTSCGWENELGMKFCGKCGNKL